MNDQTRSWVYPISRSPDLLLLLAMAILLLVAELANAGEKITIGEVEEVILMPSISQYALFWMILNSCEF